MVQGYSNDSLAFKGVKDTYDAVRIWGETYKLAVWGWSYAEGIAKTSAVVCTLLGISTAQYNKSK